MLQPSSNRLPARKLSTQKFVSDAVILTFAIQPNPNEEGQIPFICHKPLAGHDPLKCTLVNADSREGGRRFIPAQGEGKGICFASMTNVVLGRANKFALSIRYYEHYVTNIT